MDKSDELELDDLETQTNENESHSQTLTGDGVEDIKTVPVTKKVRQSKKLFNTSNGFVLTCCIAGIIGFIICAFLLRDYTNQDVEFLLLNNLDARCQPLQRLQSRDVYQCRLTQHSMQCNSTCTCFGKDGDEFCTDLPSVCSIAIGLIIIMIFSLTVAILCIVILVTKIQLLTTIIYSKV